MCTDDSRHYNLCILLFLDWHNYRRRRLECMRNHRKSTYGRQNLFNVHNRKFAQG
jgi:hypothetical protein